MFFRPDQNLSDSESDQNQYLNQKQNPNGTDLRLLLDRFNVSPLTRDVDRLTFAPSHLIEPREPIQPETTAIKDLHSR